MDTKESLVTESVRLFVDFESELENTKLLLNRSTSSECSSSLDEPADTPRPSFGNKLSPLTKLAYALPHLALSAMYLPTHIHISKFYTDTLLVPAGSLAVATVIARAVDAIIDPLMGWLSDQTSTSWGRRKPFIAMSVPINAVCYYFLLTPPASLSPSAANHWYCFFFFMYLAVPLALPLYALGAELTTDNKQRISLFTLAEGFDKFGVIVASILPSMLLMLSHGDIRAAFSNTALCISSVSMAAFIFMLIFIKEPAEDTRRRSSRSSSSAHLVPGIRRSMRNKPFRILIVSASIGSVSHCIINVLFAYFIAHVLRVPNSNVWLWKALLSFFVSSAVSLPLWQWLAHRTDTRSAWLTGWALHIPTTLAMFFLGPGDTTLFLVLLSAMGACYGSTFLCRAMLADTIDYDEVLTGRRREGQYLAWITLAPKLAIIPASALPLLALDASGYEPGAKEQNESVVLMLRVMTTVVPSALSMLTLVIAHQYHISGSVLDKIHALVHRARQQRASDTNDVDEHEDESSDAWPQPNSLMTDPVLGGRLHATHLDDDDDEYDDDAFEWFLDYFSGWELYELAATPFSVGWSSVRRSMLVSIALWCLALVTSLCLVKGNSSSSQVVLFICLGSVSAGVIGVSALRLRALLAFGKSEHVRLRERFHDILRRRHE